MPAIVFNIFYVSPPRVRSHSQNADLNGNTQPRDETSQLLSLPFTLPVGVSHSASLPTPTSPSRVCLTNRLVVLFADVLRVIYRVFGGFLHVMVCLTSKIGQILRGQNDSKNTTRM